MSADATLFDKGWNRHVVADLGEGFALLHVDRHVLADFNGNAFTHLARRGIAVRHPELTFATPDHSVSTDPARADPMQAETRTWPRCARARAGTASACSTSGARGTASCTWSRPSRASRCRA